MSRNAHLNSRASSLWARLFRFVKFVRRGWRAVLSKREAVSKNERETASAKSAAARKGYYLLHGSRYQNGGLIVAPPRTALAHVFLDVLGEMGGEVMVVMGENMGLAQPVLSISPPVAAQWLQTLLAEYEDVLKQNHNVELSVQNVEKCCSAVLTPDKHIIMHVCNPARYIHALESRGLREVEHMPIAAQGYGAHASPVDEVRLDELKQYLSVTSAAFSPRNEWLH